MAFNARDIKNNDTTDAGFDLVLDNIATLSGDVGVTKIILGAAGTDGGVVGTGNPFPTDVISALPTGTNSIGDLGTVTTVTTVSTVTNLAQLGGTAVSMNTGVRDAGTQRVTIATNDVVPASQSGTWNITNVSGTVSLPTNAATETKQDTIITSVQKLDNIAHSGSDVALVEHVPISGQLDDTATTTVTENQIAPVRITSGRALHTAVQNTVTVGAHDVTNAGTFVVQIDGTALTRLTDIETNTDFGAVVGGGVEATALRVTLANDSTGTLTVDNAGTFATQVDGDALTALQKLDNIAHSGSDVALVEHVPISGQLDDTATTTVTENQIAPVRITSGRALHTAVQNTVTVGAHDVTNAGTFVVQVDGDALTALQKLDNIAHAGADVALVEHVPISGQFDDVATTTVTENQIAPVRITSARALHVSQQGNVTVNAHDVTNGGTFAVQADNDEFPAAALLSDNFANPTTTSVAAMAMGWDGSTWDRLPGDATNGLTVAFGPNNTVDGNVAHDAPVSTNNTFLVGAEARTSEGTAVVQSDGTRLQADLVGKLVTSPHAVSDLWIQGDTTHTATTANQALFAAGAAGIKNYLTTFVATNTSSTDTYMEIKDGTTVIARVPLPANGGATMRFDPPLKTTAATAMNVATAASISSGYSAGTGFRGR